MTREQWRGDESTMPRRQEDDSEDNNWWRGDDRERCVRLVRVDEQ